MVWFVESGSGRPRKYSRSKTPSPSELATMKLQTLRPTPAHMSAIVAGGVIILPVIVVCMDVVLARIPSPGVGIGPLLEGGGRLRGLSGLYLDIEALHAEFGSVPCPQAVGSGRQVVFDCFPDVEVPEVPKDPPKRSGWGLIVALRMLDCHSRHWDLARGLNFQAKPARGQAEIQMIDRKRFRGSGRNVAQNESRAGFLIIGVQQVSTV